MSLSWGRWIWNTGASMIFYYVNQWGPNIYFLYSSLTGDMPLSLRVSPEGQLNAVYAMSSGLEINTGQSPPKKGQHFWLPPRFWKAFCIQSIWLVDFSSISLFDWKVHFQLFIRWHWIESFRQLLTLVKNQIGHQLSKNVHDNQPTDAWPIL